jgi:hypothetical protein
MEWLHSSFLELNDSVLCLTVILFLCLVLKPKRIEQLRHKIE